MNPNDLQKRLLDLISSRFSRRADVVSALSEVLHLSQDAVYRRMRGDTLLSPSELETLCLHFRISLDALIFGQSDVIISQFNAVSNPITTFDQYLEVFLENLKQARQMPNVHFYFASAEIPVFTYMFFPKLIRFKLYVWGRVTWHLPVALENLFSFELIPETVIRDANAIVDEYVRIPSTELLSVNICDNTLAQIEHHLQAGGFKHPEEALVLCDQLDDWIMHIKLMTETGVKFKPGEGDAPNDGSKYYLYQNEMVYNNITGLIKSDVGRRVYCAYCNPNFLYSSDEKLCEFTEQWFMSVLDKSTPISRTSEKTRAAFFNVLRKKVNRARKRIELLLEEQAL